MPAGGEDEPAIGADVVLVEERGEDKVPADPGYQGSGDSADSGEFRFGIEGELVMWCCARLEVDVVEGAEEDNCTDYGVKD